MNVLHVCANPKPPEESASKQLSIAFISKLIEVNPDAEVNNVDLYQDPPPFLSYEAWRGIWLAAMEPTHKLTKKEQEASAYANRHAELFNQADLLVLTMPMWNFGPPAIMKAWLDMVLSPGRTFDLALAEGGGLQVKPRHKLQRVVLLVSSGGVYAEDDPRDALTRMIRSAFAFIGVDRIQIAWADGQTPLVHGDHEQRRQMAIEAATDLAEEIGEESLAAPPA
ncbi:MAG: NAD(P)H-dependent oxidoreductase [Kiritimatiellae bacterium]|nr:NAD(P)H-dependent oxidoreductase [Kiritimatiellia bacterium]